MTALQLSSRLFERQEWQFFATLPKADAVLAVAWWAVLLLRGVLPVMFAIAMGALVAAVQAGSSITSPLGWVGATFILLQTLPPIHRALSYNLGDRTAAWLYDRLTEACIEPPGIGHLEDPKLTSDLTTAREFDLGMTGPPLSISMDFIAAGMVETVTGLASVVVLASYSWWAALLLGGAWLATHWWLRESAVWQDRNTEVVRSAQRDAEYMYRLAVDPPAAKEVRLFGLSSWILDTFLNRRRTLHSLQYRSHPVAREARDLEPSPGDCGESRRLLVACHRRVERPTGVGRCGALLVAGDRNLLDRLWRIELGARRSRGSRGGGASAAARDGARGRAVTRNATRRADSRAGDSIPRRDVCLSWRRGGVGSFESDHSRRVVARHRRTERRWQDDDRETPVPPV